MEHAARDMIEQMTFELKVDDKINLCGVPDRNECPSVREILQRSVDGMHEHLSRSIQRDFTRETFLEWAEPDDQFGDHLSLVFAEETRTAAPRNERGIILYVRHDSEKLVGAIMERRPLLVMRHVTHLQLSDLPCAAEPWPYNPIPASLTGNIGHDPPHFHGMAGGHLLNADDDLVVRRTGRILQQGSTVPTGGMSRRVTIACAGSRFSHGSMVAQWNA
jgi:hypothetical protein